MVAEGSQKRVGTSNRRKVAITFGPEADFAIFRRVLSASRLQSVFVLDLFQLHPVCTVA